MDPPAPGEPHNPSLQEGLHPASELARFFPDLVRESAPLYPPSSRSPLPPGAPTHSNPVFPPPGSSFGYINGQPVPIPTQPVPLSSSPHPLGHPQPLHPQAVHPQPVHPQAVHPQPVYPPTDANAEPRPASPYYSNMYLARQQSQPPHFSPTQAHTPSQPQIYASSSPLHFQAPPPSYPAPSTFHAPPPGFQSSPLLESKAKPKKDKQPGMRLTGKRIVYNLDHQGSTPKKQLEATPITLYNSDDSYNLGCLIAANKNYICYAVRGEMVRVLSRHASSRALMRGHTGSILELSFFSHIREGLDQEEANSSSPEAVDLLASTAKDGNIFLWKITCPSADTVLPVVVLNIFSSAKKGKSYFQRVRWHPTDANVLAAASVEPGGGIYIFNIASLISSAQNKANPQSDIDQLDATTGVRILKVPADIIAQDLAFSPDGTLLAAGFDDGRIRVWDLRTNECIYDWVDNIEETAKDVNASSSPISSVLFPSNAVIATSTHKNSTVHLWSLPAPNSQPTCLQSMAFKSEKKEFLGHLSFDPCGNFLFLASASLCVGFIIHLDSAGRGNKDKDNRVYTSKFDYLTEFEVTQPILSFTVGLQINNPPQQNDPDNIDVERKEREYIMQLFCVQTKAIQIHQTSTEHCYSSSKQPQEDDALGPITQTGKIGESSGDEPEAPFRPPLTASGEAREHMAEYAQHQENLWLSHSVETRRDSYVGLEEYQDPMLSPSSTAQIPIPAQQPQAPATPEQPQEHSQEQAHEQARELSEQPTQPHENEKPQEQSPVQSPVQSLAQPHEPTEPSKPSPEPVPEKPQEQSHEQPREQSPEQPHAQIAEQSHAKPQEPTFEPQKVASPQLRHANHTEHPSSQPPDSLQSRNYLKTDADHQQDKPHDTPTDSTTSTSNATEREDKPQAKPPAQTAQAAQTQAAKANKRGNRKNNATEGASPDAPTTQTTRQQKQKASATAAQPLHLNAQPAQPTLPKEEAPARPGSPSSSNSPVLQDDLRKFETNMMSKMERLFAQQLDRQYAKLEKDRLERERLEKERQEKLLAVISQTLNTSIQQQLERIVKKEFSTGVEKLTKDVVQTVEAMIVKNVAESMKRPGPGLAKGDSTLYKEALDKMLPHMSSTITEALRQPIQQSFVQYFQDRLIPSFDQSCKVMFNQLNGTFEEGIQDLIANYKIDANANNTNNNNNNNNNGNVLADQLRVTVQTLLDATSSMSSSIIDTQNKLLASHQASAQRPPVQNPQPHHPPPHQLPQNVPALPSSHPGPYTPSTPSLPPFNKPPSPPNPSIHATLNRLIAQTRFNEAFDLALSASDLALVTWLCAHVGDARAVLASYALSQPVLLSLVQQLGYDLESGDVLLKLRWLNEVIPYLDTKSPNVPAHQVGDIIAQLRMKLVEYYPKYSDPAHPCSQVFKMLYQVVCNYQGFHFHAQ